MEKGGESRKFRKVESGLRMLVPSFVFQTLRKQKFESPLLLPLPSKLAFSPVDIESVVGLQGATAVALALAV